MKHTRLTAHRLTKGQITLEADQLRQQVAILQHQAAELTSARTELTGQLTAERAAREQQCQRAESAEQHTIRSAAQAEQLCTELTTARAQGEHWQAHAAEVRAELAGVRSQLTAAHAAAQTEKDHAAHRLAGQQTHYEELINELRTRLHQPTTPQPPNSPDDR